MRLGTGSAVAVVGGITAILALKLPLYGNRQAIGMHAAALAVPLATAMLFAVMAFIVRGRLDRETVITAVALFVLLVAPFADVLDQQIVHLRNDDSFRYSTYAHHILKQRTLWGADGLLHEGTRSYVDQPGYRYYLAATIGLLGGEHRGLQLFNMGVLLGAMLWTIGTAANHLDRAGSTAVAVFLLAATPYAAKNILYGYTEWLAVALFMTAGSLLLASRPTAALLPLALVPFVRQNLLLISALMALHVVTRTHRRRDAFLYLAVLGLPLYHNLYFAREWRFLVANRGEPADSVGELWTNRFEVLSDVLWKLVGYAGYHPAEKLTTIAVAMLFAPLGTALIIWWLVDRGSAYRWTIPAVMATVAPTLFFGSGSYPRFEFVNQTVVLLALAALSARSVESEDESTRRALAEAPRPP